MIVVSNKSIVNLKNILTDFISIELINAIGIKIVYKEQDDTLHAIHLSHSSAGEAENAYENIKRYIQSISIN